jgi:hypothetical protein
VKVNTKILEDPNIEQQIGREFEEMMKQVDESWNPHMKLEFLKMTIRTVFSSKVSEVRKHINFEIVELEEEINQFEELKMNTLVRIDNSEEVNKIRMMKIDTAINNLKVKLYELRNKQNDKLTFVSKAKWFKYGEKSNKFFLNLMNSRQNPKLISKISDGSKMYQGQEEVTKGITDFYRKLYENKLDLK